jgi:hypothetical protein
MLQFAQAVPGSAQIIGDLIAKNMDWPGADEIAERLKRAVPPQILGDDADPEEQNTPQAQAAKQAQETAAKLAAAQAQAKMAEQDAKTAKTNADAEKTRMDALNAKIDAIGKILDRLAMGEQISGDQINAPMWPDPGAGNAPPIGNAMGEPSAPQPMPAGPGQPLGGQPVGNALAGLSDNRPPPPMPGGMTPQAAFQVPTGGLNEFLGGNGQQDSAAPSPGADYGQSG